MLVMLAFIVIVVIIKPIVTGLEQLAPLLVIELVEVIVASSMSVVVPFAITKPSAVTIILISLTARQVLH